MKIFSLKNRYRASSVFALSLAFLLAVSGTAYATLTLNDTSVVSGGVLTLQGAAGSAITVGSTTTTGNIAIGGALTSGSTLTLGTMTFLKAASDGDILKVGNSVTAQDGKIWTYRNNGSSISYGGLNGGDDPSPGTFVQSYGGIFYNTVFNTLGTLDTRLIIGTNIETDFQLQSAHALLLVAQDGSQTNGVIKAMSQTGIEFHARYNAEELSPKRLIVDRVSTASIGSANTSDVTLGTNAGKLYLQYGTVLGGVVFPNMTTTQRNALTGVAGEVIYNTTDSKLQVFTTTWVDLH